MPAPDPRVLIHLAKAQAELNAAMALLSADVGLELPPGVEFPDVPEPCSHPTDKIHRPIGARPWCAACGEKL